VRTGVVVKQEYVTASTGVKSLSGERSVYIVRYMVFQDEDNDRWGRL